MKDDLPTLPTDPTVIELTDRHTDQSCYVCDDEASFYVVLTAQRVNEELGVDIPVDEWPVNSMLCTSCFRDAPRVDDWGELPGV